MKKFTFIVSFLLTISILQAQDYLISFTGSGQSNSVDSIQVENLSQGTKLSFNGNDVLHLVGTVGINALTGNESNVKIYPNPMIISTLVEFFNSTTQPVCLEIYNEMGVLIAKRSAQFQKGRLRFEISGLNQGIYNVNVKAADWRYSAKLISIGNNPGNIEIKYQVTDDGTSFKNDIKSTQEIVQMQYNDGEMILFKSFAENYSRVLTLVPTQSQTVNFEFVICSDNDGKGYSVVTIGSQTWMAENLAYLPSVSPSSDGSITIPYYYVNGYQGTNVNDAKATSCYQIYGVLYNWPAALDACPSGWHLPSDGEWTTLTDYLGGLSIAGGKLKETGTTHWESPNSGATNENGFTALPAGDRDFNHGVFGELGYYSIWWSSTESSQNFAWYRYLDYNDIKMFSDKYVKPCGYSVRCIKD
ncbi:MAG TPA: FISUMP domain-containing protein [Bacteroidales bacterium]